jgi:uncharacterized protein with NRDE domain
MCLIVFAWRPGHPQPLVLAANRDEFHARPSLPLAQWVDAPQVHAGRDLQAGGTWLGLGSGGRFAALTNIRELRQPQGARSRGELTANFLCGDQPPREYLHAVAAGSGQYSGFNLLSGDHQGLFYLNSQENIVRELPEGVYGLSNASLDSPWPKLLRARQALQACLDLAQPAQLLELLRDPTPAEDRQLPETGIGLAGERLLSSVFISSPGYGTRASTALICHADGSREIVERSFAPDGSAQGEVQLRL